jgi:hypothetical protein
MSHRDTAKPGASGASAPPESRVVAFCTNWIDQQTSFGDTDFSYISGAELLHGFEDRPVHNAESV